MALLASAPACNGVIDTFTYTLIGSIKGDIVEPASSDTATVSIAVGTALRQIDAVDRALLLLGSSLVMFSRRRRADIS